VASGCIPFFHFFIHFIFSFKINIQTNNPPQTKPVAVFIFSFLHSFHFFIFSFKMNIQTNNPTQTKLVVGSWLLEAVFIFSSKRWTHISNQRRTQLVARGSQQKAFHLSKINVTLF